MDGVTNAGGKRKRKLTALPLLIVLFVISYCLLTKLVIEQDKTIDSQRSLIHLLFKDNVSLAILHRHAGKLSGNKNASGNIPVTGNSANQTKQNPSDQVSSIQVPSTNVPSLSVKPQTNAKTGRKARRAGKTPSVSPPAELSDPSDMRRVSFSI
jgi:hypothetical protein